MSDFCSYSTKGMRSKIEGVKPQAPKGSHHATAICMCEGKSSKRLSGLAVIDGERSIYPFSPKVRAVPWRCLSGH